MSSLSQSPLDICLYVRQACHLCDIARNDVQHVIQELTASLPATANRHNGQQSSVFHFRLVDIDKHTIPPSELPKDFNTFTIRVPVLAINNKAVLDLQFSKQQIKNAIKK